MKKLLIYGLWVTKSLNFYLIYRDNLLWIRNVEYLVREEIKSTYINEKHDVSCGFSG